MMRSAQLIFLFGAISLAGCQQQMAEQPAYRPLEASAFFTDERSARPLPEGTVPRGPVQVAQAFYTGRSESAPAGAGPQANMINEFVKTLPLTLTTEVCKRGRN